MQQVCEDLFFIERGYLNGNHFVYRGAAPLLIDSGYLGDVERTLQLIGKLGVDPMKVGLIVSTHCHCDHIGAHKRIQQLSGCDIALHEVGKAWVDAGDNLATWSGYYHQEAEFFHATHSLADGDPVTVGPHEFQVIHVPGHSADGIALYNRREKILISSDILWEYGQAVLTERLEGSHALKDWQESLERLALLEVKKVYPGHGKPFADFTGAIARAQRNLAHYEKQRSAIGADLLKKITVYTLLMHKSFPSDRFFDHLLASRWFAETVDAYELGDYKSAYGETMTSLQKRGTIYLEGGCWLTSVVP